MKSVSLFVFLSVGFLFVLHLLFPAESTNAQTATMEDLIQAQAQGASEAELIGIYRSGLSANSRDRRSVTPLHVACRGQGYLYFAKMLLSEGANANSVRRGGWTPLMDASSEPGKGGIVRLLLMHGALPDIRKLDGQTALHLAAFTNDFATARALVEARANLNVADNRGRTPVYYVTGVEVARLLIENGAKLNIVDRTHISPFRYIRDFERQRFGPGQTDLSSYLKSLGAQ
jgi:ankyrin repeat protein